MPKLLLLPQIQTLLQPQLQPWSQLLLKTRLPLQLLFKPPLQPQLQLQSF